MWLKPTTFFKMKKAIIPLTFVLFSPITAEAAVPTQYISKLYTELLGRMPDVSGFNAAVNYFQTNGCSAASLQSYGIGSFQPNTEFTNISGYKAYEQVLLAYRFILNEEPDQNFNSYVNAVNNGTPIANIATSLFNSTTFSNLAPYICQPGSYGFGTVNGSNFVPSPPAQATAGTMSEATLQSMLMTNQGSTISLPSETFVSLTYPLVIPAGTTLTTAVPPGQSSSPGPQQHALMARLVRGSAFNDDLVKICPQSSPGANYGVGTLLPDGSKGSINCSSNGGTYNTGGALTHIWIDGQRGSINTSGNSIMFQQYADNVHVYSGISSIVNYNFISNNDGANSVLVWGSHETNGNPAFACGGSNNTTSISYNLITVYPSRHKFPGDSVNTQSDGITDSCEGSFLQGNSIIDATDAGIAIEPACPAVQHSQVYGNVVFSAANSATTAIGIGAFYPVYPTSNTCVTNNWDGAPDTTNNMYNVPFAGTVIEQNQIWTGINSHFILGYAVGDKAYFQLTSPPASNGSGGSFDRSSYTGDGGTSMQVSYNGTNNTYASTGLDIFAYGLNNVNIQQNTGSQRTSNSYYTVSTSCAAASSFLLTVVQGTQGSFQSYQQVAVPPSDCITEVNAAPPVLWRGYFANY